jgi:hypothetical protein
MQSLQHSRTTNHHEEQMKDSNYDEFYKRFDGRLVLASNRQRGVWSYMLAVRDARMVRAAGVMQRASHDTLLAIALTSALDSITVEKVRYFRQTTSRKKPKIEVRTSAKSFAALMTSTLRDKIDPRKNGFRCASHIVLPLFRQAMRFDLEFVTEMPEMQSNLRRWSANALCKDSRVFAPQAVTQI